MERHAFEIEHDYSDAIAQQCHCLSGIDVRVKLVVAVAAIGVTVGARGVALPLAMLGLGVGAALAMRVPLRLLVARLLAPFGVAAVVMLGQLFFWNGPALFTLSLGPWQLVATHTGLHQGLLIGARVLGSGAVVLALGLSTPFQHLLAAARWFRAPAVMVEVASLMYRFLFLLREEAATMIQAQRVRLGYTDYRRGVRCAAAVCGMAFVRAHDRASDIHRAMACRGYNGDFRGDRLPPLGWRQAAQLALSLALLAAAGYLDALGLGV